MAAAGNRSERPPRLGLHTVGYDNERNHLEKKDYTELSEALITFSEIQELKLVFDSYDSMTQQ